MLFPMLTAEKWLLFTTVPTTVGAQSIACRHSTYVLMAKKSKFRKFLFGNIKKDEFARRFFKKNSVFSRFKLLNKHFSKLTFYF
jgi:hypothetical protein